MSDKQKTLGVIGGLGPLATAYFIELVVRMTDVSEDQQHLPMIVYNMPHIPDRTAHILDNSKPDPLPVMLSVGNALQEQGADCMVIPCVTAHYFLADLQKELSVPFINGIYQTVRHLKEKGVTRVGIMATDGTIRTDLLSRELVAQGLTPIIPDAENQAHVMHVVYENVKAGKKPDMDRFAAAAQNLRSRGAEAIILGCTELSLIKRDYAIGPGFIDAMEILAQQAVIACGKPLKETYRDLITK